MSIKQHIMNYLTNGYWCSGMELEDNSRQWQTKASTISRRCRELADDGTIERRLVRGCVQYKLPTIELATIDPIIEEQGVLL